jgi:DHA1 family tetracycline resistance protein-like MFS transporter
LIGPAVKYFGESRAMFIGLVFGVAGFAAFGLAASGLWFLAGIPLLALWGIASAPMLSLMSRHVSESEQGRLQGANASMMGIASLIGPGIFTQAFALSIGANAIVYLPGAPFLLAASMIVASLAVAVYTMHKTRDEKHA